MLYVRAIRKVPGIEARAIPLYLPPDKSTIEESGFDKNVFFGAISMYLREKVKFLRNMPAILDKFFDSSFFLRLAAKQAGTTSTEGYEELTISMIEGDNAFRKAEVDRLVKYLVKEGKPDIIHLSNALILGIARQLKKRIDVKVVCSLLNEDDWIDDMVEPYRSRAWEMIAKEAGYVDVFITPSIYYKNLFMNKTGLNGDNVYVVPLGFDPDSDIKTRPDRKPSSIGYFSRVNYHNGFDKLVDAFIECRAVFEQILALEFVFGGLELSGGRGAFLRIIFSGFLQALHHFLLDAGDLGVGILAVRDRFQHVLDLCNRGFDAGIKFDDLIDECGDPLLANRDLAAQRSKRRVFGRLGRRGGRRGGRLNRGLSRRGRLLCDDSRGESEENGNGEDANHGSGM
jgi:glycosyltransferase involved in cell wall biosynthesis